MTRFAPFGMSALALAFLAAHAIPAAADQVSGTIVLAQSTTVEEGAADKVTPASEHATTPLQGGKPEEGAADAVTAASEHSTTPLANDDEPEEGAADPVKPQ